MASQDNELPALLKARAARFSKATSLHISTDTYPAEAVKVQNTFIHVASPTNYEPVAQSCPSSNIGRLRDVFEDQAPQVLCLDEVLFEPSMPSTPEALQVGGVGVLPGGLLMERLSHPQGTWQPTSSTMPPPLPRNMWTPMPYPPALDVEAYETALQAGSLCPPDTPLNFSDVRTLSVPSEPAPGSVELPSVGSKDHSTGECKPCAFLHVKGCDNGAMCKFCHLCDAGEKKRRQKAKKAAFKGGA